MSEPTAIPRQVTVTFDVPVPMRDGVSLAADVYTPSDGPAPVLLMRTPYGKDTFAENAWAGVDPVAAAKSGFIVVIQDTRGRFASGGDWAPLTHDAQDGYDTVEWAARLPGATGRVGMFGGSYSGNTQWQAALAGPPSLAAIAPLMTWSDPLDGLYARGGAAELGLALPWSLLTGADDVARRFPTDAVSRVDAIVDELDDLGATGRPCSHDGTPRGARTRHPTHRRRRQKPGGTGRHLGPSIELRGADFPDRRVVRPFPAGHARQLSGHGGPRHRRAAGGRAVVAHELRRRRR
jgi:predicted acyl esterase